jgi:hypothetical protein
MTGSARCATPIRPSRFPATGQPDPGHGPFQVSQQAAPAVKQFRAGFGERDDAPGPPEQPHLKQAFQPRDGL